LLLTYMGLRRVVVTGRCYASSWQWLRRPEQLVFCTLPNGIRKKVLY